MQTIHGAVLLAGLSWVALAAAQAPIATSVDVAFEVASIKPNNSGATNSSTSGRVGRANDAPSIFAALQEQLGLRLDSQRGPVEFLVVDSIERPTPD